MRKAITKHHVSLKAAIAGVGWAIRTQPNFRIHLALSSLALLGGWYFRVTSTEILILVFMIILGLAAEMINTAIESMTDLITREWRAEAKIAKDVSAGMMLITATGALIVAFVIFFPYIFG